MNDKIFTGLPKFTQKIVINSHYDTLNKYRLYKIVCDQFKVNSIAKIGTSREFQIPREIYIALCVEFNLIDYKHPTKEYTLIGEILNVDRTSVIHQVKKANNGVHKYNVAPFGEQTSNWYYFRLKEKITGVKQPNPKMQPKSDKIYDKMRFQRKQVLEQIRKGMSLEEVGEVIFEYEVPTRFVRSLDNKYPHLKRYIQYWYNRKLEKGFA